MRCFADHWYKRYQKTNQYHDHVESNQKYTELSSQNEFVHKTIDYENDLINENEADQYKL